MGWTCITLYLVRYTDKHPLNILCFAQGSQGFTSSFTWTSMPCFALPLGKLIDITSSSLENFLVLGFPAFLWTNLNENKNSHNIMYIS